MSSCNFGTLASFARLPMSDVVVRSRVKSGGMLMVNTGTAEVGVGGIITICKKSLEFMSRDVKRSYGRPKLRERNRQRDWETGERRHGIIEQI